jgi:hypothetical protein
MSRFEARDVPRTGGEKPSAAGHTASAAEQAARRETASPRGNAVM